MSNVADKIFDFYDEELKLLEVTFFLMLLIYILFESNFIL